MADKIIKSIKLFIAEVDFMLHDNTTEYGLTKEERIAVMNENRAYNEAKDKALRAAGDSYMEAEEYMSAGICEKIRIICWYGIILNNSGEVMLKPKSGTWSYVDARKDIPNGIINPEKLPKISEESLNALAEVLVNIIVEKIEEDSILKK